MTRLFLEMNQSDIEVRIANEGRVPLAPLVRVHELREGGAVIADDNVAVDGKRPLGQISSRSVLGHAHSCVGDDP